MSPRPSPDSYGTPNGDLIRAWFELDPDDDVDVEGVIVGDGRAWDRARVVRVPDAAAIAAVAAAAHRCDDAFVVALAEPEIDALVESIVTAPHHEET